MKRALESAGVEFIASKMVRPARIGRAGRTGLALPSLAHLTGIR